MFLSTTFHPGPRRVRALVAFTILAATVLFAPAREAGAQCTTNSDCLWPVGCSFDGETGVALPIPGAVLIRSLVLADRPACTPVAAVPFTIDSFFDVFFDLSLDGGINWVPKAASGTGRATLNITSLPGANPRTFDTEMLMLDISGGSLPAGIRLRESPTRASLGHTDDTSLAGGQFKIDSFFDVFFELSSDGGATWFPAVASTHLRLGSANPTTTRFSTWGRVKSIYR